MHSDRADGVERRDDELLRVPLRGGQSAHAAANMRRQTYNAFGVVRVRLDELAHVREAVRADEDGRSAHVLLLRGDARLVDHRAAEACAPGHQRASSQLCGVRRGCWKGQNENARMMPSWMSFFALARCCSRTLRRCAKLFGLSGAYTRNSGLLSCTVAGREDIVCANGGSGRGERKRPGARRGREAEARVLCRDALGQHRAEYAYAHRHHAEDAYAHDIPSGPGEPEERQ
jgi:hypothetical protein